MDSNTKAPSSTARFLAWAGFVLLVVLHLDSWRPKRDVIWFGWMPEELVWRLAWMALALLYLIFFCNRVWSACGDREEG